MSVVTYNGIEIKDIKTNSISHEPQFDAVDPRQYLYTKVSIDLQGVLNTHLDGTNPTARAAAIRQQITEPRGTFVMTVAGNGLFSVTGPDITGGPFPRDFRITQISEATYIVHFRIDFAILECSAGGTLPYLSHRWRESISLDERFLSKRTRNGHVVFRGDVTPDIEATRDLVGHACPIPDGFKRISADYTLIESGLELQYSIVDQETPVMPPDPALKASGEYVESTAKGAIRHGEVRVRLEGGKQNTKENLLRMAIIIALDKLKSADPVTLFLLDGAIKEDMYDNVIEVRLRTMLNVLKASTNGAPLNLKRFIRLPTGSTPDTKAPDLGTRGTAGLTMAANFLQDPCAGQSVLKSNGHQESTLYGSLSLPVPTISTVPVLPDSAAVLYANDASPGVYTDYRIDSRYRVKTHKMQLSTSVANNNTGSVIVQLGNPISQRVVTWTAEKIGDTPLVPTPASLDPNAVIMDWEISPCEKVVGSDGVSIVHRISGAYTYAFRDNSQVVVKGGVPPWVDPSVGTLSFVQSSSLNASILDPPGSVGGGGGGGQSVLTSGF